ncbi:hypothetical protein Q31b_55640 [Novipirellula aureliae]|uniref:Uncharacterized protein n=1 Tax=Novipirellula aureliae TaxID=2527966 RepID=A0A5C6DAB3_9BACT|nr:hypothetical protein Q31b_55640 [Novipirellula aureliae]
MISREGFIISYGVLIRLGLLKHIHHRSRGIAVARSPNPVDTVRELYLMIRTFPRHYEPKYYFGVVHTQSALQMHAECVKYG